MPLFTHEQIESLAPDAASLKAGKDLANARKWPALAINDRVLWGEVQGSGKTPYRTQIDLTNLAFNCSCPSRKFPCKHGLGLLLLYQQTPDQFTAIDEPTWVCDWIDKRQQKAAKTARSPDSTTDQPQSATDTNDSDRQKRAHARLETVQNGITELTRWLEDLVRTGLLSLPEKGQVFWQNIASRMVDAKAPGLAYRVNQLGQLPFYDGPSWQSTALQHFGQLYLLLRSFERLDQLPPDLQADVKAAIGLTVNNKDLLSSSTAETLTDRFWVLARQTTEEDALTVQRTYLYGQQSTRFALELNYSYKNAPTQTLLVPGTQLNTTLFFYPGRWPHRAVIQSEQSVANKTPSVTSPPALPDWESAQQHLADVLSQSPWAEDVPQLVGEMRLATDKGQHYLYDSTGRSQPISQSWHTAAYYSFLAVTGGQAVTVFVLRSDDGVQPLGVWTDAGYYPL